jgi:hypothetical protein
VTRKNLEDPNEADSKDRVVHIRVNVEMWLKVRRAAMKVDRRPSDFVRRAILAYLAMPEAHK